MELRTYPDRVLRTRCEPVREITDDDLARMRQMLELMYQSEGVGLAGPQVGWPSQVVTLDVGWEKQGDRMFVNPRILSSEGEVLEEEGCLSVPGVRAPVRRAEKIVVVAYSIRGDRIEREADGLLARAWQHEVDHLNGILFVDRLDPTALFGLRRALKELEQNADGDGER